MPKVPVDVDHGRYSPAYIVSRPEGDGAKAGEWDVLYSNGTACSSGTLEFDQDITTHNLHRMASLLGRKQEELTPLKDTFAGSDAKRPDGAAFDALDRVFEVADWLGDELQGETVRGQLEDMASNNAMPEWISSDKSETFFELEIGTGEIQADLRHVQVALCKKFTSGGLVLTVMYCERSFYATLEEADDEMPLFFFRCHNVSNRGATLQLASYNGRADQGRLCLTVSQIMRPVPGGDDAAGGEEAKGAKASGGGGGGAKASGDGDAPFDLEDEEALDKYVAVVAQQVFKHQVLEGELQSARDQLDQLQELMALESELEEAMSKRDELQRELEAATSELTEAKGVLTEADAARGGDEVAEGKLKPASQTVATAQFAAGAAAARHSRDNINVRGPGYGQMYCVMHPDAETGLGHKQEAMFKFGNWCYQGYVDVHTIMPLLDQGKFWCVVPALQRQQGLLGYLCEAEKLPQENKFSPPLREMVHSLTHVEAEMLAVESVLQSWLSGESGMGVFGAEEVASWLDDDAVMPVFEFQTDGSLTDPGGPFDNVAFLAAKVYDPRGVMFLIMFHGSSFYVGLLEAGGGRDQPLLDTYFPDLSDKRRGFQLNTFPRGVTGWPELRKLTLWQMHRLGEKGPPPKAETASASADGETPERAEAKEGGAAKAKVAGAKGAKAAATGAGGASAAEAKRAIKERQQAGGGAKAAAKQTPAETAAADSKSAAKAAKAQAATSSPGVASVARPHHLPAMKSKLGGLGPLGGGADGDTGAAPWDAFGRPVLGATGSADTKDEEK